MDLGSPEFVEFTRTCIDDLKAILKTANPVFAYIANGHGAWEAALANVLNPGDRVLVPGTGHFSRNWAMMAEALGVLPEVTANDWRHAVDPDEVEARLREDKEHRYKAVLLVHTDTATGISNDVAAVRRAIDRAGHPALYLVDAIASLGTVEFRTDDWGVDVAVAASQKGLMSPPGLSFTSASDKALRAARNSDTSFYWDWTRRAEAEWYRWFCGTAPEHLLFALREAIDMLAEEGLEQAFIRHRRLAEGVRAAVRAWSDAGAVELNALQAPADSVTTIRLAEGYDAQQVKALCHERFNVSLGGGLGDLHRRAFRIGHMGDINEATLLGTLGCVEAALQICGVPYGRGGVNAAVDHFATA